MTAGALNTLVKAVRTGLVGQLVSCVPRPVQVHRAVSCNKNFKSSYFWVAVANRIARHCLRPPHPPQPPTRYSTLALCAAVHRVLAKMRNGGCAAAWQAAWRPAPGQQEQHRCQATPTCTVKYRYVGNHPYLVLAREGRSVAPRTATERRSCIFRAAVQLDHRVGLWRGKRVGVLDCRGAPKDKRPADPQSTPTGGGGKKRSKS